MYEYKNKLEFLNGRVPDPENWVVYLDPETDQPGIVSSTIKDEWIFRDFLGTGREFIQFYTTGRIGRSASNPIYVTSIVKYHFNKYKLWN